MLPERFARTNLMGGRPTFRYGIMLRGRRSLPLRCGCGRGRRACRPPGGASRGVHHRNATLGLFPRRALAIGFERHRAGVGGAEPLAAAAHELLRILARDMVNPAGMFNERGPRCCRP